MRAAWLALVVVFVTAGSSVAEEAKIPRIEVGGTISGVLPIIFADGPIVLVGAGPRLGVNLTRDVGLHVFADALGPFEDRSGINGLYAAELKFPIRHSRTGERTLSVTAGLTGLFHYTRRPEMRVTRLDQSIVVHSGYRQLRTTAPRTLILGLTRDQVFSRRTSGSTSIEALIGDVGGVALRAAFGVSFGKGGYR